MSGDVFSAIQVLRANGFNDAADIVTRSIERRKVMDAFIEVSERIPKNFDKHATLTCVETPSGEMCLKQMITNTGFPTVDQWRVLGEMLKEYRDDE